MTKLLVSLSSTTLVSINFLVGLDHGGPSRNFLNRGDMQNKLVNTKKNFGLGSVDVDLSLGSVYG